MPKRTKTTEKKDKFSYIKGKHSSNVITKYAVPTSPGRIFNVKHRKEHRKNTSLTDTNKASSSRNVRDIIVISDSESDSQISKGDTTRQNLRSQSTKSPVLKHSKRTAKDMRSGARLSTGGWTQTGVAPRGNDSRAVLTQPIQISDSPVSLKGSSEIRANRTLNSEKSVSSRYRLKLGESTPSQSSPHASPVLHSSPNPITSTPKVGAIMQPLLKGRPVAQSAVKSSKVNTKTLSKQMGSMTNSPRSPDPRKILDKYTKMLSEQRNITPLKCTDERRSQKLFQSTPHKDKTGMSYPRLVGTQEAHNEAEKDVHHKDEDIPLAYQHLRDISGRRQLYGTHRICSSEAVRPSSAGHGDHRGSGDRLFKRPGKQESQQRRESHEKLDKRTGGETSRPKEILKHRGETATSQGTGLVKKCNLVKNRDLEGLSQGRNLKTATSPYNNGGRKASGKRSVVDRAIDEFVTEMAAKTNKVFTDRSNNRTNAEDNHQEIGHKTTKKGTVHSRSSSSNSTRSSRRQKNNSVSSETSGLTGVFNFEHRTMQNSDSENDPGCSKYEAAHPEHPTNSKMPQSEDRKFSNKIESLTHNYVDSSQKTEARNSGSSPSEATAIISPVLSRISRTNAGVFFPSASSQRLQTQSSKSVVTGYSPVLTSTTRNVAETSKKRMIDENAEDKLSTKRTKNFMDIEHDEKRMKTILDSVLSEAKKKSKEKRLGSLGSPVSRRSLFSSPAKHRSFLMTDQDHPLNRMLKSYRQSKTDTCIDEGKLECPKSTTTNNATNSSGVVESGPSGSKASDALNKPLEQPSQITHVEDDVPKKANATLNILRAEKTPGRSDVITELSPPNASISSSSNSQHGEESQQNEKVIRKPAAPANLNKRKDSGTCVSSQVENITPSSEAELWSKVEEQAPKPKVSEIDSNAEPSRLKVVKWPTDIKFPKLTLRPIFTVTLQNSVKDFKASRVTANGTVMSQSSTKEFNVTKVIASNSVTSQSKSNVTSMQKVKKSPRVTSSVRLTDRDLKSQGEIYCESCSRNSESKVIDLTLTDDGGDSDLEIVSVMTPNTPAKLGHIVQKTQRSKTIISTPKTQSLHPILGADKPQGLIDTGSRQRVLVTKDLTPTSRHNPEQQVTISDQGCATDSCSVPVPQANPDLVEQNPVPSNLDTPRLRGEHLAPSFKDKPSDKGSRSDQVLPTKTRAKQVETKKLPSHKDAELSKAINELHSNEQRQASTFNKSFEEVDDAILSDVLATTSTPGTSKSPSETTGLDDAGRDNSENNSIPDIDTTDHGAAVIDMRAAGHDMGATDHGAAGIDMRAADHDMDATDHGAAGIDMSAAGHDMDATDHGAAVIDMSAAGHDMDAMDQCSDVLNQDTDANEAIPSNTKNFRDNIFENMQYNFLETGDEATSDATNQDSGTTSKMSTAGSNSPLPERDSEATTCLPSSDDLAANSTDLKNVCTAESIEAEKQDSNLKDFSVHVTSEETTQGSKSIETEVQGSKVDDIKDFETSMFDISQFFDDDADSMPDQLSDAAFEMNDYLPEVLREDAISALRQNRSDSAGDVETTMNEDLIDELPDLTQTPRAKRRRFTDKDTSQKTTVAQSEKMMSRLLERTFTTRQSSSQESVADSDWMKELDEAINIKPSRTRNARKRLRSTDRLTTLKMEPTFTEILADTAFSRSYKIHGASLKKLVREKKREAEVDKMEEILLSDLKKGGFRKTLEQAANGGQGSNIECDEDTKRAINLMKKDWGTLPILPFSGGIFRSKKLRYCMHKMELKSCFDAESLEGLAAGTRTVVLRLSAADITYQSGYLNFLLNQPKTRTQTYKWLLDVLHCYRNCEAVQDIIQSNLRLQRFDQSPFSYSQFRSALIDAGVSTNLFDGDHGPQRTQQLVPEYSVCEACSRKRQKTSARHVVSIAKVLSTVSHLFLGYLTDSEQIETAVFLLLLLQERNIRRVDVMEIVGLLLKELTNWESEKYLIVRRLLELCTRLNTLRSIAMRLHFNGERPHELSRILSFALLKLHVFGDEPQTTKFDNFNDLEALVDIVDHFNPDNLELLLVPEESEGQIGSQKRSYYHLSLLLPLLNICIGDKCKDETTFVVLDRIWSILRSMNKSIRDNGAIYRSQVKYEMSLFTKHLRILIQKAPKKNKASIFKYLRSAPVKEEVVDTSVGQSCSSSESSDEVEMSYNDDEEVEGQVPRSTTMVKTTMAEELDEFRIAQVIKNRIIGSAGKD